MTSIFEQILSRVFNILSPVPGIKVFRSRTDAFLPDEGASVNIIRSDTNSSEFGDILDRHEVRFMIEFYAYGANAESAADDMHMQAHGLLMGDSQLSVLGNGLRCTGTNINHDAADVNAVKIVAEYKIQALTKKNDFTIKF